MPQQQQEQQPVNPFEYDAYDVLASSTDYTGGLDSLISKYKNLSPEDQATSRQILSDYGDRLTYKFKQPYFDLDETMEMAPVKMPTDVPDDPDLHVKMISAWEDANKKALSSDSSPERLAVNKKLLRSLSINASSARRSILSGGEEADDPLSWMKDKFFRMGEGLTAPFRAIDPDVPEYFAERTLPSEDPRFTSKVASALGMIAPVVAAGAATGGAAVPMGMMALQGAGSVASFYQQVKEQTGSEDKATEAAVIDGLTQLILFAPAGKILGELGYLGSDYLRIATTEAGKKSVARMLAQTVVEGAGINGALKIGSNLAENAGFDMDESIFRGVPEAMAVGGTALGIVKVGQVGVNYMNWRAGAHDRMVQKVNNYVADGITAAKKAEGRTIDPATRLEDTETVADLYSPLQSLVEPSRVLPENIKLQNDIDGKTIYAVDTQTQKSIGKLEYEAKEGEPINVKMVEVDPSYRRQGIGTALVSKLQDEFPATKHPGINWGWIGSEEGDAFVKRMMGKTEEGRLQTAQGLLGEDYYTGIDPKETFFSQAEREAGIERESTTKSKITNEKTEEIESETPNYFGRPIDADPFADKTEQIIDAKDYNFETGNLLLMTGPQLPPQPGYERGISGEAMIRLARAVARDVIFTKRINAANAYFHLGTHKIHIPKSLATDPELFVRDFAHEIGHAIDRRYNTDWLAAEIEPVIQKMRILASDPFIQNAVAVEDMARDLSAEWRGEWRNLPDAIYANYKKYRSRPTEIYADVMSAIFNDPFRVRDKYPTLFEAFEKGISRSDSDVGEAWDSVLEYITDPDKVNDLAFEARRAERRSMGEKSKAARIEALSKKPSTKEELANRLGFFYSAFIKNTGLIKRDLVEGIKSGRIGAGEAWDLVNDMERRHAVNNFIELNIARPVKGIVKKIVENNVDPNAWAEYIHYEKILKEKTPAMEHVEQNPAPYMEAVSWLLNERITLPIGKMRSQAPVNIDYQHKLRNSIQLQDTQGFIEALAQSKIARNSAEVYRLSDFEAKYKGTGNAKARAQREYGAAIARLEKARKSPVNDALAKAIEKAPDPYKPLLQEVMAENAFNARRFLLNRNLDSLLNAQGRLDYLKRKIGPAKYQIIEDASKEFHEAMASVIPLMEQSGIVSDELLERIILNKGNYSTNAVLKYFESDRSISPNFKTALGSIEAVGNELAATVLKMEAIAHRSYRQTADNALVKMAQRLDIPMEMIKPGYGENIFEMRDSLIARDRKNSYMIEYQKGKPYLWKIEDPRWKWATTFVKSEDVPGISLLSTITRTMDKMFFLRDFKTRLSPSFMIGQKFYDRGNEAAWANSYELPGLGIHVPGTKLAEIDLQTTQELNHFFKTGEAIGNFKKALDLDAVSLHYTRVATDFDLNTADAMYQIFGTTFEDIAPFSKKYEEMGTKLFEKVGLGKVAEWTERDEMRTKVNGFALGKATGMTDTQAADFARQNFGTPDPTGGGMYATPLNDVLLFGRAWINGTRALANFVKSNPQKASIQVAYRVILPKFITSAAIMGPIVASLFGQEASDLYKKLVDKIPSFDRIARTCIPVGFIDEGGKYLGFGEVMAKGGARAVGADWKAAYFGLPQPRELTTVASMLWPMIEETIAGDIQKGLRRSVKGAEQTVFMGNMHPAIQYAYNMVQLATTGNATDFFRQREIFKKDVAMGGSIVDKTLDYSKYVASQQLPGLIPYNLFTETAELKGIDETINKYPLVGPVMKTIFRVSNFGDYEKDQSRVEERDEEQAAIRLKMEPVSNEMYQKYRRVQSFISTHGTNWRKDLTPREAATYQDTIAWHSYVYKYHFNEARAAYEKNDFETLKTIQQKLEQHSKPYALRILGHEAPSE